MATKKGKGIGGRKPGMTKEIVSARKHLRTWAELEHEVSEDVLEAYNVVRSVMKDSTAPPASRRAAANDIIAFFKELQQKSEKTVEDFEGSFENDGGDSDDGSNVQPLFKWSE